MNYAAKIEIAAGKKHKMWKGEAIFTRIVPPAAAGVTFLTMRSPARNLWRGDISVQQTHHKFETLSLGHFHIF